MKKLQTILTALFVAMVILLPHAALAQFSKGPDTCSELSRKFENANGASVIANVPKYCNGNDLYTKFINYALYAIGIVAVIAIIYGGYMYMTARGNEAQKKKAKDILTWAIIGLAVVLAATTIVNVVVKGLVENRFV